MPKKGRGYRNFCDSNSPVSDSESEDEEEEETGEGSQDERVILDEDIQIKTEVKDDEGYGQDIQPSVLRCNEDSEDWLNFDEIYGSEGKKEAADKDYETMEDEDGDNLDLEEAEQDSDVDWVIETIDDVGEEEAVDIEELEDICAQIQATSGVRNPSVVKPRQRRCTEVTMEDQLKKKPVIVLKDISKELRQYMG